MSGTTNSKENSETALQLIESQPFVGHIKFKDRMVSTLFYCETLNPDTMAKTFFHQQTKRKAQKQSGKCEEMKRAENNKK